MNVTLLGNCQTKALSWYIEQLDPSFDVKWICMENLLKQNWGNPYFRGKPVNTITDIQQGIKALKLSDYVIFQHIKRPTSKNYNLGQLKKHTSKGKLMSISSLVYDPSDPTQQYLKGMIKRAQELNIDIPAHKMIEKHGSKITMQQKNHPHVFYFLELVREICAKTGWNYYSDEQYDEYLKEGYPFG